MDDDKLQKLAKELYDAIQMDLIVIEPIVCDTIEIDILTTDTNKAYEFQKHIINKYGCEYKISIGKDFVSYHLINVKYVDIVKADELLLINELQKSLNESDGLSNYWRLEELGFDYDLACEFVGE